MRNIVLIALVTIFAVGATVAAPGARAPGDVWTEIAPAGGRPAFLLDVDRLRPTLETAPEEFTTERSLSEVTLPMPDGGFRTFTVEKSAILAPELAAKHGISTYRLRDVDDPRVRGRIVFRGSWLSAAVLDADKRFVKIRRVAPDNLTDYVSSWEEIPATGVGPCGLDSPLTEMPPRSGLSGGGGAGDGGGFSPPIAIRPYRYAVATTPGFTADVIAAGETVHDVVTDLVSELNVVLEDEVAVRLVLNPNNDLLYFDDRINPPPAHCGSFDDTVHACGLKVPNQCAVDWILGTERYDVGHLLAVYNTPTASGCSTYPDNGACTDNKAHTVSKHVTPADPLLYTTVHETGHQFGASHTLTSDHPNCIGAFYPGSGVEPGSGSTILAYPGFCPGHNISWAGYYFHVITTDQINAEVYDTANCFGTPIDTGNYAPVVAMLPDYGGIPKDTEFTLTGSATDDQTDLWFTWDQVDIAPFPSSPYVDDGPGDPIFRSGPLALNDPERTFTDELAPGAILPTTERALTMRLVARDGVGGLSYQEASIDVSGDPFRSLIRGGISVGSECPVEWDAGGSPALGVQDVDIFISEDGGQTFPSTPTATVPVTDEEFTLGNVPGLCPSANALMRLEPVDTAEDFVFYAESPVFDLQCTGTCPGINSCPIGCRTSTFPTLCPAYPLGAVSCEDGDDVICCEPGKVLYEKVCECEAIIPGTLCPAEQSSLVCRYPN